MDNFFGGYQLTSGEGALIIFSLFQQNSMPGHTAAKITAVWSVLTGLAFKHLRKSDMVSQTMTRFAFHLNAASQSLTH